MSFQAIQVGFHKLPHMQLVVGPEAGGSRKRVIDCPDPCFNVMVLTSDQYKKLVDKK